MDFIAQKKFLYRIIGSLLALNIIVIGFMLFLQYKNGGMRPPPPPPTEQDIAVLKQELTLNRVQEDSFRAIRDRFYTTDRDIHEHYRPDLDKIIELAGNQDVNMDSVKAIARAISEGGYDLEMQRYQFFRAMFAVCTPQQKEKLRHMPMELRRLLRPRPQPRDAPPPPPPHDRP